jgi:hypothetical protein
MNRRSFLSMMGLAPVAAVASALPASAMNIDIAGPLVGADVNKVLAELELERTTWTHIGNVQEFSPLKTVWIDRTVRWGPDTIESVVWGDDGLADDHGGEP